MYVDQTKVSSMQLTSIGFSLIPTIVNVAMGFYNFYSQEDKFCFDNATVLTSKHGFSLCAFQGVINLYCGLGLVFSWCAQMVNIFLVIIMNMHYQDMSKYRRLYIFCVFLLPSVTIARALQKCFPGYSRGMSFCFTHDSSGNADIVYYFFPVMLATVVSSTLFGVVIRKAMYLMDVKFKKVAPDGLESGISAGSSHVGGPRPLRNSAFSPGDLESQSPSSTLGNHVPAALQLSPEEIVHNFVAKLRILSTPLKFASVFLVCVLGTLITRIKLYSVRKAQSKVDGDYDICIFENFYDGYTEYVADAGGNYFDITARDDYAAKQCGDKPNFQVHYILVAWFFVAVVGHSFLLTLVLVKKDNMKRLCYLILGYGGMAIEPSPRTQHKIDFRDRDSHVSSFVEVELNSPRRGNFQSQLSGSVSNSPAETPEVL